MPLVRKERSNFSVNAIMHTGVVDVDLFLLAGNHAVVHYVALSALRTYVRRALHLARNTCHDAAANYVPSRKNQSLHFAS